MSAYGYREVLINTAVDGPTLTAAAAATMLPPTSKFVIPQNWLRVERQIRIIASGRISCAVTTPGTARFDVRLSNVVVFDSQAINLNVVAKTTVGWWLDILLTCRAIGNGTTANFFGQGRWQSEAVVGSPVVTAGGNGIVMLPYNAAPAVGGGFNSTIVNEVDMFFTQTVASGSMTLHQYQLIAEN